MRPTLPWRTPRSAGYPEREEPGVGVHVEPEAIPGHTDAQHRVGGRRKPVDLAGRIEARAGDASDATVEVLMGQIERLRTSEAPSAAWRRVDASGSVEDSAEAWVHALEG